MFTGLIEELGAIRRIEEIPGGVRIEIGAVLVPADLANGDSIAVNGVCLTALNITASSFSADVSPETLDRTTIGSLKTGSMVNLERAVTPSTRLGGHIVQGHVDGRGTFVAAAADGDFYTLTIGFPPAMAPYLVFKGSVAVEGISLTVAALDAETFDVAIIPKTWHGTNLSGLEPGDPVNLEADLVAKYIERMLSLRSYIT